MSDKPKIKPSFSAGRRWLIALNVICSAIAVLALIVMANYLGAGYFTRISLGKNSQTKLSPQSVRILQSVTNEITATVFFDIEREEDLYGWISSMLREFNAVNSRIKIKTIDYTLNPAEAALTLEKFKLGALKR